ncbi:condensation domain-containing protein, partial [Mycobacterium sp. E2479]|uniref:condensation domain-containing protein n=1 Tax=Mycobacterium sp. E2479 TaxID=1834134 RepID=UPI000AF2BC5F
YRRFVSWLAGRDLQAARAAWRAVLAGFDTPTLVGPADRVGHGRRGVASYRVPEPLTRAVGELARSQHTTVNTVLQAGWAQLLVWLTGQHDVAFGAVVSGRPAEVPGAEAMVGLLINTVPVRANLTPTTTTTELLDQLQRAHTKTVEHQHLALNDIHRITGHDQLFDTVFVYENYPADAPALVGADGLTASELTTHDSYHYPLTIQAGPGRELTLRVQYRTDVFAIAGIDAVVERFTRVLASMAAGPGRPILSLVSFDKNDCGRGSRALAGQPAITAVPSPKRHVIGEGSSAAPTTLVDEILADIFVQVLGIDRVGVDQSFFDLGGDSLSALRAIAAINAALSIELPVSTLFEAPSVRSLSQQASRHASKENFPR